MDPRNRFASGWCRGVEGAPVELMIHVHVQSVCPRPSMSTSSPPPSVRPRLSAHVRQDWDKSGGDSGGVDDVPVERFNSINKKEMLRAQRAPKKRRSDVWGALSDYYSN